MLLVVLLFGLLSVSLAPTCNSNLTSISALFDLTTFVHISRISAVAVAVADKLLKVGSGDLSIRCHMSGEFWTQYFWTKNIFESNHQYGHSGGTLFPGMGWWVRDN